MECLICNNKNYKIFDCKLLFNYHVSYFECKSCGFIQTESPYWLSEAYKEAITFSDIGLVSRNINLSQCVSELLIKHFDIKGKFLDFGGGYGLFVRLMRDKGFNFYRQDIFCANIFAQNFDINDISNIENRFEIVTSFEVFEHTYEPYKLLSELLNYSDNILFSTLLVPKNPIKSASDWWYISPDTGQHVAFYTTTALSFMANKYGINFYSDGQSIHLFTKKKFRTNPLIIKRTIFNRIIDKVVSFLKTPQKKMESLVSKDLILAKNSFLKRNIE